MPIHQQLWSLEYSVIETVGLRLHSVMEHYLARIQSRCTDKLDDIQAVRKSSTDQCNSFGQLVFCRLIKKILVFLFQETPTLTISFFEKLDVEWYGHFGEMSLFDKLILVMCLLRPVSLSDVLSDVIGVIIKYSADSALSKCQSNSV